MWSNNYILTGMYGWATGVATTNNTHTAAFNITTTTATTKSSNSTTTYLLQYTTGFHTSYNVSIKDQAHSQFS